MIRANTNFLVDRKFFGGVIPSIDVEQIRRMFDTLRKRINDVYNVTVTGDDTADLMSATVDAIRDFYEKNPKIRSEHIYIYVETNAKCSEYQIVVRGDGYDKQITKQTEDYDLAEQQETKEFDEAWGFTPIDDDDGFRRVYKVTYDNKETSLTEEQLAEFKKVANKRDLCYKVERNKDAELAYYMTQLGFDETPKTPTKDKPMVLSFYGKSAYLTGYQCAYMNWIIHKVFDEVKDPPKMILNEYKEAKQ